MGDETDTTKAASAKRPRRKKEVLPEPDMPAMPGPVFTPGMRALESMHRAHMELFTALAHVIDAELTAARDAHRP